MLTHRQHLAISSYWAAVNFMWGSLLLIVLPKQVEVMKAADKGPALGLVIGIGAVAALTIPLWIGPVSDRCTHALGRRRPFIFVGTLLNLVCLGLLAWAGSAGAFPLFVGAYFLMTIGNNIATAAYTGVIPDLVASEERGKASGYMAVMSQLGTLAGVATAGFLPQDNRFLLSYGLIAGALVLGLWVTMVGVRETPLENPAPAVPFREALGRLWSPLRDHDFRWVWITRALVMAGFYSVLPLLQYFIDDRVSGAEDAVGTAAMLQGLVLICATLSGYIGGVVSDRLGRRRIVGMATLVMAAVCLALVFTTSVPLLFGVGAVFGLGYGAYVSVDWALGADALPNKEDAAKDMAVWHIAGTLPQAIMAPIAGMLAAAFGYTMERRGNDLVPHYTASGYAAVLLTAAVMLVLGAIFLRQLRNVR